MAGLACYGISLTLFSFQTHITSSVFFIRLGSLLGVLVDYLWSIPSAIITSLILFCILWFYSYSKGKREIGRYSQWVNQLPSFFKLAFLSLLLIYTLFPLRWAQRGFTRSLESFPDFTPFDLILMLLNLGGTILCTLYFFKKLPLQVITLQERFTSHFFRLRPLWFIATSLVMCFLATGVIAYIVLDHIPHVEDSIAQLFQAKIFKMGKLYATSPPHKEFFDYINIINDGKWYSQYPPGHPLLLTLGLFLGTPWVIGPILGTLSLLLFFVVVKEWYSDRRILYLSCGLMLLSPFFLFMSSNSMNHNSTLFFVLLFFYFYLRMFSSFSCIPALLAGFALGYALLIRPLTAIAIGIPFTGNLLYCVHKKREVHIKQEGCFFITLFLMIALLLIYNYFTTGNPFLFGYQKHYHTLGFLGSSQLGPPHTLKGGIINTSNNLIGLNLYLFEWPIPSLIPLFIFFALSVKKTRWEYIFLSSCVSVIIVYFFYWYQDLCFGPRFYYSLLPFMVIFTVRGFLELPNWLEKKGGDRHKIEASLFLLLFLCILYTLSFSLPSLIKKYSNDYWFVTDKIHTAVKKQGITNAVVFIDVWHPPHITEPNLIPYGSGFQFNSPDLKDDVIYAIDLREKNIELMKAFPNRSFYLCKIHSPMSGFTIIKIDPEKSISTR